MSELEKYEKKMFEEIRHLDENYNEYWEARLQKTLEYKEWRKFSNVIKQKSVVLIVIILLKIILST